MKRITLYNLPFVARNLGYFQIAEVVIVVGSIATAVWAVYFRSCGC